MRSWDADYICLREKKASVCFCLRELSKYFDGGGIAFRYTVQSTIPIQVLTYIKSIHVYRGAFPAVSNELRRSKSIGSRFKFPDYWLPFGNQTADATVVAGWLDGKGEGAVSDLDNAYFNVRQLQCRIRKWFTGHRAHVFATRACIMCDRRWCNEAALPAAAGAQSKHRARGTTNTRALAPPPPACQTCK